MKVFISWSGTRSKRLAEGLRDWIRNVFRCTVFFSEEVEKGALWNTAIAKALRECDVGLICVTADNLASPALLFEAGAIFRGVDDASRAMTVLLDVGPAELKWPLAQFQHTRLADSSTYRDEIMSLGRSLNRLSPVLEESELTRHLEKWWVELDEAISSAKQHISAPGQPRRTMDEKVDEILSIVRVSAERELRILESLGYTVDGGFDISRLLEIYRKIESEREEAVGGGENVWSVRWPARL